MFTANGAKLLDSHELGQGKDYIILVKWRDEYVTARMHTLTDNEWYWGHYFGNDRKQAEDDFAARVGESVK